MFLLNLVFLKKIRQMLFIKLSAEYMDLVCCS